MKPSSPPVKLFVPREESSCAPSGWLPMPSSEYTSCVTSNVRTNVSLPVSPSEALWSLVVVKVAV